MRSVNMKIVAAALALTAAPNAAVAACGHIGNHQTLVVGAAQARIVNGPAFTQWLNAFYGGSSDAPNLGWGTPAGYIPLTLPQDFHTSSIMTAISDSSTTHCTIGRVEYTISAWDWPTCQSINGSGPWGGPWTATWNYNTCNPGDSFFRHHSLLSHVWVGFSPYFKVELKMYNASGGLVAQDTGCYKVESVSADCDDTSP